ncbi:hypothetical protein Ciccas_012411, partial [Cichlidogyrus casuarinus]
MKPSLRFNIPIFRSKSLTWVQILMNLSTILSLSKFYPYTYSPLLIRYNLTNAAQFPNDIANHALVMGLIKLDQAHELLHLLKDRIFLDFVSANILMKHFRDKEDFSSMVHILWEAHIQDLFKEQSPNRMLIAFSFDAIAGFLKNKNYSEYPTPAEPVKEEDIKYVRVPFKRNPSFDNFFDVSLARSQAGLALPELIKTLTVLQIKVSEDLITLSTIISLALAHTPQKIVAIVENWQPKSIAKQSVELLLDILNSSQTIEEPCKRGEAPLPTKTELEQVVVVVESKLKPLTSETPDALDLVSFLNYLTKEITSQNDFSKHELQIASEFYQKLEADDLTTRENYAKLEQKREALREAKSLLLELLEQEEYLNYFEKADEVKLESWLAPRTRQEKRMNQLKKWRQDM